MLCYMSFGYVFIGCGLLLHREYENLFDEYEQCLDDNNCIEECSDRGCRIIGCDIFYCPKEPFDNSFVLYIVGGLQIFIFTPFILHTIIADCCKKIDARKLDAKKRKKEKAKSNSKDENGK